MYKGERDPLFRMIVPCSCCSELVDHSGHSWVEIFVPPVTVQLYNTIWSSVAVKPLQVYNINDMYNEVCVNAGTRVECLYKTLNQYGERIIIDKEYDSVERIFARFLQYEYYKKYGKDYEAGLNALYISYEVSGLQPFAFVKRL